MAKLILVPTPIGNLKDITLRAIEILTHCDLVICEDTRVTLRLLTHLGIQKKCISFNVVNEHKVLDKMIETIIENNCVCLLSDAGTPAISDPGYLLVRECLNKNIHVECLPGPVAFIPALVQSGLPMHSFIFEGFLPHKKGKLTKIKSLLTETRTVVFYESTHRIVNTLEMMLSELGENRRVSVARELTKLHEEMFTGTLSNAVAHFKNGETRGEFVLIVEGVQE